jgi:hypothetical protein
LHDVKSPPAKVGDRLNTRHFNTGAFGFAAPEDATAAVCVPQGTELASAREVKCEAKMPDEMRMPDDEPDTGKGL